MNSRLWIRGSLWSLFLLLVTLPVLAQTDTNAGRIVFGCVIDGQSDICVMNPDGSGLLRLTNDPNWDGMPHFSPDGTQIAFVSQPIRGGVIGAVNETYPQELYVMQADGSQRRRLTWHIGIVVSPDWSPNNTQITYHLWTAATDTFSVRTIDIESGIQNQLLENAVMPRWSPDGSQIVFVRFDVGYQVYVMNADGSHVIQLSENERFDHFPCWSQDGTQIVFSSRPDAYWNLYMMNADGSHVQQLTDDAADDYPLTWSPDGRYLVFRSNRAAPYLFMLDMEDGSIEPLALPDEIIGDRFHGGVDWSANVDITEVAEPITADGNAINGLWMETWAVEEQVCWNDEQQRFFSNQPFLLTVTEDGDELEVHYLFTDETLTLPRTEPDFYYGAITSDDGEAFGESHVARLTHMEYAFLETFNEECFISNGAAWDYVTDGAYCTMAALGTPNLRSGPGTNYQRVGALSAGEGTIAIEQTTGDDGYVWYRLYDNKWIRSDLVDAESSCADLPSP